MNDESRRRVDRYYALREEFPNVAGVAFDVSDGLALALEGSLSRIASLEESLRIIRTYAVSQETDVLEDFKACADLIVEQVDIAIGRAGS